MAHRRGVHPDLVGATGLEVDLEQRGVAVGLDRLVVGDARLAGGDDGPAVLVLGVPVDGRVDRAAGRVHLALHERVVGLVDRALLELPLERGVGALALRDHHEPCRPDVEAVHDALALVGPRGRDAEAGAGEAADDGRAGPPRRGVRRDADGLVDDHDVVVVEHDAQALDGLRHDAHRLRGVGERHLEPAPGDDASRLAHGLAVEQHLAVSSEVGGPGPRQPEEPGERSVDALPLETLRDGEAAVLSHRQDRRPSISMPRSDRSTMRIAEHTIAESARLNTAKCGTTT